MLTFGKFSVIANIINSEHLIFLFLFLVSLIRERYSFLSVDTSLNSPFEYAVP